MGADPYLIAGGVFVAVAALLSLVGFVAVERLAPERRRLEKLARGGDRQTGAGAVGSLARDGDSGDDSALRRFVPKSSKEMSRIQRQMARAGYTSRMAATLYGLSEILVPLALAGATLVVFGLGPGLMLAIIAGGLGYLLPGLYLSRLIRDYKKQIRNGLADALDLIIVCVEAGSGLDQALLKTTEELRVSYPALAAELAMITTEIRAGKPRIEAFSNFADRTKVEDVRGLVSMLIQTDRFGTSIAQALRTYADVLRTKRRQRAEEKAAKLGVKMVFPLVLCLFPALYVVVLGSAVIKIIRFFQAQP
jgi:tight adherence protein C